MGDTCNEIPEYTLGFNRDGAVEKMRA
jgi:hypothetical protein